ncbi:MAG TPA: hypothetical protein VK572_00300 [Burkholderiales bacterium]|nr:hypothetical protein [Burkholderiales bacterium]
MGIVTSNPFTVGITTAPTFSMPTVADELATYALWGWTPDTTLPAPANPVFDSAAGYTISGPDIHGDTEGDDVWAYLQAFNRRTTGRNGYLQRAQAWRNYYVNSFENSPEQGNDESFLFDHFYGWGLQQFGTQFADAGATAEALKICTTLHDWWAAGGRNGPGRTWPVAGAFDIAHYGHRGPSRNLHTAVIVADATGDAKAIELRDRLIELWLQSTDWDNVNGMYWVSSEQMGFYNVSPPLSFAAGDRAVSSFHIGQLAEAFFAAWLSPNVTSDRKTRLRAKIVAMATWMRANGLDPNVRYSSDELGIKGSGGAWWNYSLVPPVTTWDGVYTISIVNLLVMAYKFTGDTTFLSAPPPPAGSTTGPYSAKYCFNRGTKNIFGSTTTRECADNKFGHLVDTKFDTSTGSVYLYNNKGELQYTYLIFENGGVPTVFPSS